MKSRVDPGGLALLALGGIVWLARDAVAWAATAQLPSLGFPLLALLVNAAVALLLISGAYRLREPLGALLARVLSTLDAAELRLEKLPARRGQIIRALTVGLIVGGATAAVFEWAYVGSYLETRALDLFFRLRFPERSQVELATGRELPSANKQDDVVVIALDDETIAHTGWPMPRVYYARLIDAVSAAKPASLTFDISLVDPAREHPEWDLAIGEAAKRSGNVAFSFTVARLTGESRAQPSEASLRAFEANTIPWQDSASALPEYAELIGGDAALARRVGEEAKAPELMSRALSAGGLTFMFLAVLVGPVLEELAFRGYVIYVIRSAWSW